MPRPLPVQNSFLKRKPLSVGRTLVSDRRFIELLVPFEQKDEAHSLGMQWHSETKLWCIDMMSDTFRTCLERWVVCDEGQVTFLSERGRHRLRAALSSLPVKPSASSVLGALKRASSSTTAYSPDFVAQLKNLGFFVCQAST